MSHIRLNTRAKISMDKIYKLIYKLWVPKPHPQPKKYKTSLLDPNYVCDMSAIRPAWEAALEAEKQRNIKKQENADNTIKR